MSTLPYVIVTPARNEEKNIGRLIESVLAQTCLPLKWIIISDNSTDATDEIVGSYVGEHDFIELMRADGDDTRSFSSKAGAVSAAYDQVRSLEFSILVVMDADMSLGPDCFERLLGKCAADPKLGIAGAVLLQVLDEGVFNHITTPEFHVSGGLEMFRRECFEEMGGFRRLAYGGMDTIANVMARMNGWDVRTFTDITVNHHGPVGRYRGSIHRGRFRHGVQDYSLGYHPVFFVFKMMRRLNIRYGLVSAEQSAGYLYAMIRRVECAVDPEVRTFIRREQMERLRDTFRSLFVRKGRSAATE